MPGKLDPTTFLPGAALRGLQSRNREETLLDPKDVPVPEDISTIATAGPIQTSPTSNLNLISIYNDLKCSGPEDDWQNVTVLSDPAQRSSLRGEGV